MKIMKRLLLGMVTATSGVLIACAYGMLYAWNGRVLAQDSKQPIPGIQVTCKDSGGGTLHTTTTDSNGEWSIGDYACSQLTFTDVDGAANGAYDATTMDQPPQNTDIVIELAPTALP
ncbi:MAG: carboxypeptidase regulatory-like domain-containing protein [Polyangia bacterium]|jgi:hypothetical protein|nr:carboxypeptidase regulatory-like domain-containing protein [Polyangia bacterium]